MVWKNIIGYEGIYAISNSGEVKSLKRKNHPKNKLRKLTKDRNGYMCVTLINGKKKKKFHLVHRLVLLNFKPIGTYRETNHKNGKKDNNRLSNLEWNTRKENQIHAFNTGLQKRSLVKSDVIRIRKLFKTGLITQAELCKIFGVSRRIIGNVVHTKGYRDVEDKN